MKFIIPIPMCLYLTLLQKRGKSNQDKILIISNLISKIERMQKWQKNEK